MCWVQVKKFMTERFVPILNKLPEACDWQVHVVTVTRPTVDGDANRSLLSPKDKKFIAAALCREADKLGSTGALPCCL